MFHTIRWRLVASFILLALLTVSVVSVTALEIMRRYTRQQELDQLQSNAEAIARQAAPMIWPRLRQMELNQLARAASFLGSMRVRILDHDGQTLVDSGLPEDANELLWIVPPTGQVTLTDVTPWDWPQGMLLPWDSRTPLEELEQALSAQLPSGTSLTIVRQSFHPPGYRFSFRVVPSQGAGATSFGKTENESIGGESGSSDANPRSTQVLRLPVQEGQRTVGFVELSSGPDLSSQALAATRWALLVAGIGAIFLAGLVGLGISQRLAAPLRNLKETAGQMAAGDLSARALLDTRDEIGELAIQFNRMAERLESSFQELQAERDTLRRFIADASHELRTPITALMNFNALLQGPAAGDPPAQAEFLKESEAQIQRLEWITHNLLDLSRIEAGLADLEITEFPVAELLTAAAAPFRPQFEEKEVSLVLQSPEAGLQVQADRGRLELALSNLLDNALKFTPVGEWIELGARKAGQSVQIWVQDNGKGIPGDEALHVFERFYRGRRAPTGGSGLGLSIVEGIVKAHQGKVWVESELGQGARFVMELPTHITPI